MIRELDVVALTHDIERHFPGISTELIAAGGLAILLALTADALLVLLQRLLTPWTRARAT